MTRPGNARARRRGPRAVPRWCAALVVGLALGCVGAMSTPALAQVAMPDPSQIHGKALPAPELPDGTVTVRVVRESVGNNIPDQDVRVIVGGMPRTARTDEQGRAEFSALSSRGEARAEANVNGELLVSDPFQVPTSGGLRVILVAGIADAAARQKAEADKELAAPVAKGVVVLGSGTRVLMEFRDDSLQAFYILQILNNARTRVDIGGPLIIDLPSGAGGATVIEGSSSQATVIGDRLTITGPFAPGPTDVQLGFVVNHGSSNYRFEQKWPVAVEQVTFAIEKIGSVSTSSTQFASTGEVRAGDGTPYLLSNGPALPAGSTLAVSISGLPAHSAVPMYVALGLALAMLAAGGWLAFGKRVDAGEARRRLIARRDTLLGELTKLEQRLRSGHDSPRQAARRQRLLSDLEQIYGELDDVDAGPQGGGEGVAA